MCYFILKHLIYPRWNNSFHVDTSDETFNEDGSILGNLFVQSTSIEEKSGNEDTQDKEKLTEDAFKQSGEIVNFEMINFLIKSVGILAV